MRKSTFISSLPFTYIALYTLLFITFCGFCSLVLTGITPRQAFADDNNSTSHDVEVTITIDEDQVNMQVLPDANTSVASKPGYDGYLALFLAPEDDTTLSLGKHKLDVRVMQNKSANVWLKLANDARTDLECVEFCHATDNSMGGNQVGEQPKPADFRTPIKPATDDCWTLDECELEPNTWGVTLGERNRMQKVPGSSGALKIIDTLNPEEGQDSDLGSHRRNVVFAASTDNRTRPGVYTNQVVYTVVMNP